MVQSPTLFKALFRGWVPDYVLSIHFEIERSRNYNDNAAQLVTMPISHILSTI